MKGMAKIAQEVSERSLEECQAIAQTVKKQVRVTFVWYGRVEQWSKSPLKSEKRNDYFQSQTVTLSSQAPSQTFRIISEPCTGMFFRCSNEKQAALDAFVIALNVAAFWGYGTIPLDVFYPNRTLFTLWFPPGKLLVGATASSSQIVL